MMCSLFDFDLVTELAEENDSYKAQVEELT